MRKSAPWFALLPILAIAAASANAAANLTPAQTEFFETHIRPVLVEQCYKCHNSAKLAEGSLALDFRDGLLKGGDGGAIVVPGQPGKSRLLPILRHEISKLRMPKNSGKLSDQVIGDFEKWIAMGAPDPRDKPPSIEELAKATSWETTLEKRKQWWSFQPIRRTAPPAVAGNAWAVHPVDCFVLAKMQEKGLEPGERADARTLVRRLYFALVGLPPGADEIEVWAGRLSRPGGYEKLVDHLLESSHFGEQWARHWMDWVRYAESHGSEGDPEIVNAWVYRDYLIRALNADVSFDQLVREDVAGDLLEKPRINKELGINESIIGAAQWRMVYHGFAPTDPLAEKVRFVDDEIGTFSKAFLGLTVSCARCHNHKFDPISQADYYALFGILGSCRPGRVAIDTPEKLNFNRDKLAALKPKIRDAVADAWLDGAARMRGELLDKNGPWKNANAGKFVLNPLFVEHKQAGDGSHFAEVWQHQVAAWKSDRERREKHGEKNYRHWNMASDADYATWYRQGNGLAKKPSAAGEFSVATSGDNVLGGIYPAGVYSNTLTAKSEARLSSAAVHLDNNYDMWLRVIGDGGATARYVVQTYPRTGVIFPEAKLTKDWQWQKFDLTYWNGDELYVELAAGEDAPIQVNKEARSWFGMREAAIVPKGSPGPPAETSEFLDPLFDTAAKNPPKSIDDLADCYMKAITGAINAWRMGSASDAQAILLDTCLRQGLLSNRIDQLATAKPLVDEYRRLEAEIIVPTRVPGLQETVGKNQALFEHGNHKQPMAEVPRRFLEAIDATPYQTPLSGRRQLAEDVLRDDNPLTRRVIVNRIWHHLFGRGIVATPDNFGKLGIEPTHPELLDYLATRFEDHNGSIKDMIRFLVTSKTWQLTSRPSAKASEVDPDNHLWSHARLHRLEAESIRDELLVVSGSLNPELFGAPVDGNSPRRSVYVRVRRNAIDPFLRAFDFPEPFSATGQRDVTNVPAQSLTMMNDDRVAALASAWATRVLSDKKLATDEDRIRNMFLAALGRPARESEVARFQAYLLEAKNGHSQTAKEVAELHRKMDESRAGIANICEPIRSRLMAASATTQAVRNDLPRPIGRWEFKTDFQDLAGSAHGESRSGARIEGGALVLNHQGFVITEPLKQTIKEKTLQAWVQLDSLDQRGGGVMSIQTPDGAVFDAIVFGEQSPREWMAGSNFFQRTQSFNAAAEHEAASRPVQISIAYYADGRIAAYRDGQPYGKPYQSSGPIQFKAGETVIGFGIRHLPEGGNKMLGGRIIRAELYNRALSAEEIRASSQSSPFYVSDAQVRAAITDADRKQVELDDKKIAELEGQLAAFGPVPDAVDDKTPLIDLARAMFLFKEFIYLK